MILSHRIGMALLDRENRDASSGRDADRRFDVLGSRVSRELDKLAALAARLTRLGARDLPLPAGLQRLDLPPAAQAADIAWPVSTGSAPLSSPQAGGLTSLRTNRDALAAVPVPARAYEVAVSGPAPAREAAAAASAARTRVTRPFLPVADQGARRSRKSVMAVLSRSVPPERTAAGPASRQRAPLAVVETAVAARRGDRSALGREDRRPVVPAASLPLRAAGRVAGNGKTLSIITKSSVPNVATSAGRPGPVRRAGLDILQAAVPGVASREALDSFASQSAARGLPSETPDARSTGDMPFRLADLQRRVVPVPQAEARQDVLQRQVISPAGTPGGSTAIPNGSVTQGDVGSRQVADRSATAEEGLGVGAGKMMMVNLKGDVVIEGRRLGQVVASSQARQASLPSYGPSRVNLRAVPIHSGMQIPQ